MTSAALSAGLLDVLLDMLHSTAAEVGWAYLPLNQRVIFMVILAHGHAALEALGSPIPDRMQLTWSMGLTFFSQGSHIILGTSILRLFQL
jgi:hypothetical protein